MNSNKSKTIVKVLGNFLLAFFFLYLFLLGINLFGASLKGFGTNFARLLIETTNNPFIGLFIGILSTTIIQSSSVTTSLTVGFVAAETLTISNAIPIIMGANIGTTITNIIVSMGHFSVEKEFKRAFPASIVHDIFNILSVAVLLPLELSFHPIQRISGFFTDLLLGKGGITFESPLDLVIGPVSNRIMGIMGKHYIVSCVFSFALVILAITFLVKVLRKASAGRFEALIDQYLFRNALTAGFLGLGLTAFVQSSSVVTSLAVPLAGAGMISIQQVYPYTLGSNLGTTITTILASLVTGNVNAIRVALCHTIFNASGIAIWYPLRKVPIGLAKKMGTLSGKKRFLAFIYILVIFILIPVLFIFIFRR